jgi:hypothetical protein
MDHIRTTLGAYLAVAPCSSSWQLWQSSLDHAYLPLPCPVSSARTKARSYPASLKSILHHGVYPSWTSRTCSIPQRRPTALLPLYPDWTIFGTAGTGGDFPTSDYSTSFKSSRATWAAGASGAGDLFVRSSGVFLERIPCRRR